MKKTENIENFMESVLKYVEILKLYDTIYSSKYTFLDETFMALRIEKEEAIRSIKRTLDIAYDEWLNVTSYTKSAIMVTETLGFLSVRAYETKLNTSVVFEDIYSELFFEELKKFFRQEGHFTRIYNNSEWMIY